MDISIIILCKKITLENGYSAGLEGVLAKKTKN